LAGEDIIELSQNSAVAISRICKAIRRGETTDEELTRRVRKVLVAKYWTGLANRKDVSTVHLYEDLNRQPAHALVQQLADAAITVLKGDVAQLQLDPLFKTAIVSIGVDEFTVFQKELSRYYPNSRMFKIEKDMSAERLSQLQNALLDYDQVYIAINDTRLRPQSKLDYSNDLKNFIAGLAAHRNSVTTVFANPYTIATLPGIEKSGAVMACYQMSDELQRSAVKVITRQIKANGKLPVTINVDFRSGLAL